MLLAASTTAFFGFLRSSEFVSHSIRKFDPESTLMFSDVTFKAPRISLNIKISKTDPFRQGCTIRLSPTNTVICPVSALQQHLKRHPTKNGPLFTYADGSYLTRRRLNIFLKTALPSSARTPYSSHSFHIGAATTAAAAGLPRWLIQHLGRWNSDCFKLYIRIPDNTIDMVSTSLVNTKYIGHTWDP